jgi:hypothetical protein
MQMPRVQEASISRAQETLAMPTLDGSSATLLQGVPAQVEPGDDDAPLCAVSIEEDGAGPPPDDDVGSPRCDFVVWGVDSDMSGRTTSDDTVPAPEYTGVMGPVVAGLLLPGYPNSPFLPVN